LTFDNKLIANLELTVWPYAGVTEIKRSG
jgi:hypothetical protein